MDSILFLEEGNLLIRLQRQWLKWSIFVFSIWLAIVFGLSLNFNLINGLLWGGLSLIVIVWQMIRFYQKLPENRKDDKSSLNPSIGFANWITLARGTMIAFLSGFIMMVKPDNWIIWIPATLYLTASLLDYSDGIVARMTDTGTVLGANLDMDMDGLGVIAASLVAIHYGQIPLIYLLVGLARYLFLFGMAIRKKRGLIVQPLPKNRFRRGLAGAQMGFLVAVLFPVFEPPATSIAALFFMAPFLVSFVSDWFSISDFSYFSKIHFSGLQHLPLIWRTFLLLWLGPFLLFSWKSGNDIEIFLIMLLLFSITGLASRISSFGLMLWSGFVLNFQPENVWFWSLLIISLLIFLSGSGRFSIWKPEDFVLYHRVGEKDNES